MIVPEKRTHGVILAFFEKYYSIFASFLQTQLLPSFGEKHNLQISLSVNHSTYTYNEK